MVLLVVVIGGRLLKAPVVLEDRDEVDVVVYDDLVAAVLLLGDDDVTLDAAEEEDVLVVGFGAFRGLLTGPPVSDRLAPIRLSAIMAVTAFCQRLLTTYFLSLVLLNLVVVPTFFFAANHLWLKQSCGFNLLLGSLINSFPMKSFASDEMGSKDSSSKS